MNTNACPSCQLSPRVQASGPLLHPPPCVFQIKIKMAERYSITEESEMEEVVEEFLDLQVEVEDLVGPEPPGKGEHVLTTAERRMKRRAKERRRRVRWRAENREQRMGAKVEVAGGTGGLSKKRGANHGPHSGDGSVRSATGDQPLGREGPITALIPVVQPRGTEPGAQSPLLGVWD